MSSDLDLITFQMPEERTPVATGYEARRAQQLVWI
jgi:hypothetical protein